jgi:predicted AAA+ superfamily ATPase
MESQFREVIRQKIADSLAAPLPVLTQRDVRLPRIPNKAVAVIGMRRSGKTSLLWQELARRHAATGERDGLCFTSASRTNGWPP